MDDSSNTAGDREGQNETGLVYTDPDPDARYPFLCARPGATATWAEYLAASKIRKERYAVVRGLREAHEADPGNEEKKRAYDDYDIFGDDSRDAFDIARQYVVIMTAEERAGWQAERLAEWADAGVGCQWDVYTDWKAECERPVTAFLEDPAAPDYLFCAEHARAVRNQIQTERWNARHRAAEAERAARYARSSRGLADKARQLDGQAARLENELPRLRDLEAGAAELAEVAAELAAAGRCGQIVRLSWTSRHTTATACPLAAAHDGDCRSMWTVPSEGESSAETERELAETQAQAAQAREQAAQAAQAEEAERERERAEANQALRTALDLLRANLEPGMRITTRKWNDAQRGQETAWTMISAFPSTGLQPVTVRACGQDGGEVNLASRDGEQWGQRCSYIKRNGDPCQKHPNYGDRCGTHRRNS
jgi:hypothetical protein